MTAGYMKLLEDFLRVSDLVKFAKYSPDDNEREALYAAAKSFIDETKAVYLDKETKK